MAIRKAGDLGAVFGAVLDEERLFLSTACIVLKRTSTERAAWKNEEGRMKNAEMAGAGAEGRKRGRFEVVPHPRRQLPGMPAMAQGIKGCR